MKKVLCVINTYKKNGPSKVIKSLVMCKNKDFEISILTLFTDNDEEEINNLKKFKCKYYSLNLSSKKNVVSNYMKLKDFINKSDFDIIHTHGIIPDFFLAIMKTDRKKITTIHNNMYEDYKMVYGWKSRIMIPVQMWSFKKLDKCVCCSKHIYNVLKTKLSNVCFVRNGIAYEKSKNTVNRSDLNIKDSDCVYLYAGALSTGKNLLNLLELFKNYHKKNEILLILGDGELKEECLKYESTNIRSLGFIPNPTDYMKMADVYISASKSEGFSISVIEALQNECYLFLSDIGAHRECFDVSTDCYIGELFNEENFNKKIQTLRKKKKKEPKERLFEVQQKYFSNKVMLKGYIDVYKSL